MTRPDEPTRRGIRRADFLKGMGGTRRPVPARLSESYVHLQGQIELYAADQHLTGANHAGVKAWRA